MDSHQSESTVSWLPAHPSAIGISMQRYWYFLQQAADQVADEFKVECVLGKPELFQAARRNHRIGTAWNKYLAYPLKVRWREKPGIHHILDHSWAHLVNFLPKRDPVLATVHDVIPLRYPDNLSTRQFRRFAWVMRQMSRCDALFADSAYTKSEVVNLLGIAPDKIHVVPLGVAPFYGDKKNRSQLTDTVQSFRSKGNDIIVGCLGSSLGRKNLSVLAGAVSRLREQRYPVALLGAGPAKFVQPAFRQLAENGGFHDLGLLDDAFIDEFYLNIDILVVPSLYEGFGLPVLEAMAAGVPVICSNATSLPEVAGDAALLFDPRSQEELEQKIISLLEPGDRARLASKGRGHAEAFTWSQTLSEYRKIYRRFI